MKEIYLKLAQIKLITFVSLCLSGCVVEILGTGVGGAMWVADKAKGEKTPPKVYPSQLGTVYVASDEAYIHFNSRETTEGIKRGTQLEALREYGGDFGFTGEYILEVEVLTPSGEIGWIDPCFISKEIKYEASLQDCLPTAHTSTKQGL